MIKQKVFVGLSGGVDSSVAALRLKQRGFDVVGVFIKVWHPDFLVCNWEAERLDAMRVAAHLDIPFLTCDAEKAYKDDVADYFITEYKAGHTPNPDVMCNKYVKFGAFIDFAKRHNADFVVTGHYSQKVSGVTGDELHRGIDKNKDQSYFLWSLSKDQLAYTLLPVGDSTKEQIRAEATEYGIPTATKKDSQGVCFLGHIDIKDFLSHYIDLVEGDVLDEAGRKIGTHSGSLIYTIGQRHGFSINIKTENRDVYYVKSKNIEDNTLTVSTVSPLLTKDSKLNIYNFLFREDLVEGEVYEAQTRYRQTPFKVKLIIREENSLSFEILEETDAAASGQSCVLYLGSKCLGGGIIF